MISLLIVSALAAGNVTIAVSSTKTEVLVGEPLKLTATVSTTSTEPARIRTTAIHAAIDDGSGYRRHIEAEDRDDEVDLGTTLTAAEPIRTTLYVGLQPDLAAGAVARAFHFALPAPGTYRIRAQYGDVSSNAVTIQVKAPQGRDAELYQQLSQRRHLLTDWATYEEADMERLGQLLQDYKGSLYLFRPQLVAWRVAIQKALVAFGDSGGPASGGHPLNEDLGQVLREIEEADWNGSPYDENRLALLAESQLGWGDRTGSVDTYRLILARYPDGVMAQQARRIIQQEVGDTTPPTLQASASPATLWPPNNKLVSVTATVTVNDDTDASPSVKLLSVTCDDACNPSQDIVGAVLNTDDRSFQLRATRKGGGSGRTYTITYAANDGSGNGTTKTTTVRVPHDQGK
jgi:hypothetical protein